MDGGADAPLDAIVSDVKWGCDGTKELCSCVATTIPYNRCTTYPVTEEWCCSAREKSDGIPALCVCYSPEQMEVYSEDQGLDPSDPCGDFANRARRERVATCPY